jgi:hypothetical protein
LEADAFWEREKAGEPDPSLQNGEPDCIYREAEVDVTGFQGSLMDMPLDHLADLIKRIVQIEAPIHLDELGRRCIKHLGNGRLGHSVKRKLESAIKPLEEQGEVVQKDQFIHLAGMEKFPIRSRRDLENANLRKIEYVPPEELREAILKVVTEHIAPSELETASSVARLLGIGNNPTVQNAVREQIAILTADNTLAERAGKLFAG